MGVDYNARRHAVMANMVPLGACCALLDFDVDRVLPIVAERLPERHQNLVPLNRSVLQHAWQAAHDTLGDAGFSLTLHPRDDQPARMLIAGHEAIGIAKLHAGCGFQTYYPIAPASDESVYLESLQADWPIVVLQAEDEIASMNMAVGAAHAGIRASTSTAGPGFTLMAEGMGFASITEAPGPVVVLYQRGGPSTGLPTRNSQQDLRFALQPAHGEFPHIVVAPGDVEEAAQYTHLAFNWGDRYQVPVVVLADKFIANSHFTVDSLGLEGLPVDRGAIWTSESNGAEPYRRHQLTASGVSPRSVPGTPGGEFVTTSDEHTERGRIEEDIENRIEQMDKRMGKLDLMLREIPWRTSSRSTDRTTPTSPSSPGVDALPHPRRDSAGGAGVGYPREQPSDSPAAPVSRRRRPRDPGERQSRVAARGQLLRPARLAHCRADGNPDRGEGAEIHRTPVFPGRGRGGDSAAGAAAGSRRGGGARLVT